MVYDCIKAFAVNSVDDTGFCVENKDEQVQKGSMWELDEINTMLTGAEIQLTDLTGLRWIEISKERFSNHFKQVNLTFK